MFTYDCLNFHVPLVQNLVPGMRPIQIARSSHHHTKQLEKKSVLDTQAIPSKNDLGVLGVPIFYSKIALLRPTSWKIRTCHKSSKRFSLQNQRAQPLFFVHYFWWFSEPLAATKWGTWHEETFQQNCYLEQSKPSKIQRFQFGEGWCERTLSPLKNLKIYKKNIL